MKPAHVCILSAAVVLCMSSGVMAQGVVTAKAKLAGCTDPNITGRAVLIEKPSSEGVKEVVVTLSMHGLPPGKHGVHIHEAGSCAATTTPCGAAGGHFDPGPNGNSSAEGNHPFHTGDLINIKANSYGDGNLVFVTSRLTLSPGVLSVDDANGSAFIVHVGEDTYCPGGPATGCAGGGRAACGIITVKQ